MLGDIDEKTYEFGMLRALGLQHNSLITLIVFQAFSFSIPGILLALMVGTLLDIIVCLIVYTYAMDATSYMPGFEAVLIGITIGLVMPMISNYIPI